MTVGYMDTVRKVVERLRHPQDHNVASIFGYSGEVSDRRYIMMRDKHYRMSYVLFPENRAWEVRFSLDTMEFVRYGVAFISDLVIVSGEEQFNADATYLKMLLP